MRALIQNAFILGSMSLLAPLSPALAQYAAGHDEGGNPAVVSTSGVTVEVDPEAWRGEPARFDKVLPVLVRITNDGDVPIRIRHSDFALVTESGERVVATPPFELEGIQTVVDYDRADLTDAARTTLQQSAALLKEWSGYSQALRVTIEGHADNRGTNEYNLALGERRAASVRDYLVSLGVSNAALAIVSKGEEQPVCTEDTESCWQENRRGVFIITAR